MLSVIPNSVLEDQEIRQAEVYRAQQGGERDPSQSLLSSSLALHVRTCWDRAVRAKTSLDQRMIRCLMQRQGQYEPRKLSEIRMIGGSEVFTKLSGTKCRAAESWLLDILIQPDEAPWDLDPTPVPDLPDWKEEEIKAELFQTLVQQEIMNAAAEMREPDFMMINQAVSQRGGQMWPMVRQYFVGVIEQKAKECADNMKKKIDDQLTEGKWYEELRRFTFDLVTFPFAIMKGPIYRSVKSKTRELNPMTGQMEIKVEKKIIPTYQRRSPFDIFPSADSCNVNDGYLIDRTSLTRKELTELIGVDGFNEREIRAVLQAYKIGGLREWTTTDPERQTVEGKDTGSMFETHKIDCLEFWGSVPGSMLLEWGLSPAEIPDADMDYDCAVWLIGNHVIKAMLNPDPIGAKPFSKVCFEEIPGSWAGNGVCDLLLDTQIVCNAIARAIVNNVSMASGPQVEADEDRMMPGETFQLIPWKVWRSTGAQMKDKAAVNFYQPQIIAQELVEVYRFFSDLADMICGIPAYAHGDMGVGGAGDTSSGLSMLMTQASKGIKGVVKNVDQMIAECVERQYLLNILFEEDTELIGDLAVKAKGSSSLIAKEQQSLRKKEFADSTNNPTDIQIMGLEGRRELLREVAKSLEMDLDKVIPVGADAMGIGGMAALQGGVTMPGQPSPGGNGKKKPVPTNLAGDKSRGGDFNLFQQAGATA